MAKHGKKKIHFKFESLDFAAFFLDFIRKKKFYARVSGNMKIGGLLEFTLIGSPDNVRMGILKIKKLYHMAYKKFGEDKNFFIHFNGDLGEEINESDENKLDEDSNLNLELKLKKLKFDPK